MFLFNFALDDQKSIFILSIAFVLIIILIWVIVAKIVKSIKADKMAEKAAKKDLASLGYKEFDDEKKPAKQKNDSQEALEDRYYDDVDAKTKDDSSVCECPDDDQEAKVSVSEAIAPVEVEKTESKLEESNAAEATIEEESNADVDNSLDEASNKTEAEKEEEPSVIEEAESSEEATVEEENNAVLDSTIEEPEVEAQEGTEPLAEAEDSEEAKEDFEANTTLEENANTLEESKEPEAEKEEEPKKEEIEAASEKPKQRKGRTYNGKYEIFQTGDGYAYNLKASNGEILVTSETYTTRDGVVKAINAVKRNLETGEVRIFADKRGQYKFKLVSRNYRILAISSNYSVEKSAIRASESFKKFALKADMVDVEIVDKDAKTAIPIDVSNAEPKMDGKFVVEKFNGEYSWALKASNGQILCQAEGYTSKAGCMYSIETFKRNVSEGTFKCVKDKTGNFQYKLYNVSGRICAVGESYQSRVGAENAANSVVSFYQDAVVQEIKEAKEAKNKK